MQENYSIVNHLIGIVQIDQITGALNWDQKNLDPVVQKYVKRYLFDEGFIEQALGALDPELDHEFGDLIGSFEDADA